MIINHKMHALTTKISSDSNLDPIRLNISVNQIRLLRNKLTASLRLEKAFKICLIVGSREEVLKGI